MKEDKARYAHRIAGRLFSKGGRLHLILEADSNSGIAKVSCRVEDETQVIAMPIAEVVQLLTVSSKLKLDGLSSDKTVERVFAKGDFWFFKAREGQHGPFANEQKAERALKRHILCAQEEGRSGRPAQASA